MKLMKIVAEASIAGALGFKKDQGLRDPIVLTLTRPPDPEPEKLVVACKCGGQLVYQCFSWAGTWRRQPFRVQAAYGWMCSSCNVKLLHPAVGDELREKMPTDSTPSRS